jgi:hypothetical protein
MEASGPRRAGVDSDESSMARPGRVTQSHFCPRTGRREAIDSEREAEAALILCRRIRSIPVRWSWRNPRTSRGGQKAMPSPFPGMDPCLESQGYWQDFHTRFLTYCPRALRAVLPRNYAALIEERISLVDLSGDVSQVYIPDVAVTRGERGAAGVRDRGVLATLEPISLPLALQDLDEIRHRWIEIRRLPERALVAVIELLSPTNKIGSGRIEYVDKRREWIQQPVHVVEIDLLLAGLRLPMGRPLPQADYYAFVSRANRRPDCDVYAWSIRRALPVIPIPLSAPDPDVPLDLAAVFAEIYDDAPYFDLVDYSAPLNLPLSPEDNAWAEQQARTRGTRSAPATGQ